MYADGAIQRITTETCFFEKDIPYAMNTLSDPRGNEVNWVIHGIKLAEAIIWRINKDVVSHQYLNVIADEESEDFRQAALVMKYFMWESDEDEFVDNMKIEYWNDIVGQPLVFHLDGFEVTKEFRGKGLGNILAKQQLKMAGVYGLPFFAWPATNNNYGNHVNDPERLKKFWMNLQDGMAYNENWNTVYHRSFGESSNDMQ